jgi:hypothetical protein
VVVSAHPINVGSKYDCEPGKTWKQATEFDPQPPLESAALHRRLSRSNSHPYVCGGRHSRSSSDFVVFCRPAPGSGRQKTPPHQCDSIALPRVVVGYVVASRFAFRFITARLRTGTFNDTFWATVRTYRTIQNMLSKRMQFV